MSTLTISDSRSSAAASCGPLGADSTGLVATEITAWICPSPGAVISSARQPIGNSPQTSGARDTRLIRRPIEIPLPRPGAPVVLAANAAAFGNIAPPGSSRCPVRTLTTSISQLASVPYSCVQVPIRPYTAARPPAASWWASPRIAAGSIPQRAATRSGAKSATAASSAASPSTCWASRPSRTRRGEPAPPVGEQRVHDAEQEERDAAGADEQVLIRQLGGLRPPRVDHD